MKRRVEHTKHIKQVIIEEFSGMHELVVTNDSRKSNFGYNRRINGRDFDFDSYDEALSWLHNYDKNLDLFKTKFKNEDNKKNLNIVKTKSIVDTNGYQPLVPNALMGLPKSMIRTERVVKKSKIINVVIDTTYKYATKTREVVNQFSNALAYLASLEKQGFRVRISLLYVFGKDNESTVHACKVLLKDEKQPMDIKRMMFPLTNLGSFRLFGWDWYERLPEALEIFGYGQQIKYWNKDRQADIMNVLGEVNSKAYFIDIDSDLNSVFSSVR